MIKFEHVLPALNIEGRNNGTYNNEEMILPCLLTTTDFKLGMFLHDLHNAVADDRRLVFIDGKVLMCSNNWIRDHVHEMKAFKHWDYDLRSFLEYIINTQTEKGYFYELIKQLDDEHWKMVDESHRVIFEKDNVSLVRLELEADVEYIVVEGVMQYYRATGDLDWVKSVLPKLEKSIDYMTSDSKRWNSQYGLVIRPFTIDTWDFTNDLKSSHNRRINPNEPMSIMHGDNSGIYQAMRYLAFFNEKFNNISKSKKWNIRAQTLKENMYRHLWNGKFFIHQLHIGHEGVDDKEDIRLSLSNSYNINRGVTDTKQARSIIEEYISRKKITTAFAEWFSIDPPYEKFMSFEKGQYVNGAISPFTAGELAKAAFNNGYEEYAWDIICRFMKMRERDKAIYFLYSPENSLPQGGGPSGWGAAALLSAIDEGLAGIQDADCLYREIDFSPKFPVTHYTELRYITGYEVSGTYVDIRFILKDEGMRYDIHSKAEKINAHILLPSGKKCAYVLVGNEKKAFKEVVVGTSRYVDFSVRAEAVISIEIYF